MGGAKLKKAEEFLIAANLDLLKNGHQVAMITRAEELERYQAELSLTSS